MSLKYEPASEPPPPPISTSRCSSEGKHQNFRLRLPQFQTISWYKFVGSTISTCRQHQARRAAGAPGTSPVRLTVYRPAVYHTPSESHFPALRNDFVRCACSPKAHLVHARDFHRNVRRFRGGLVFKNHISLNSSIDSNKEDGAPGTRPWLPRGARAP